MARIRSIHPNACQSRKLSEASDGAERCYWRLACHCDDDGRTEDDPELLASFMFPLRREADAEQVDAWLAELAELGLLVRYESGGKDYLAVTQWHKYQKPQKKRPSELPEPPSPGDSRSGTRKVRDRSDTPLSRRGVEGSRSGDGAEGESEGEPSDRTADPAVTAEARKSRLREACQLLAERELLTRGGSVDNPNKWLPAAVNGKVHDYSPTAYAKLAETPTMTAVELADALDPPRHESANTSSFLPDVDAVTPEPASSEQLRANAEACRAIRAANPRLHREAS
jgi:hypothetical protein